MTKPSDDSCELVKGQVSIPQKITEIGTDRILTIYIIIGKSVYNVVCRRQRHRRAVSWV